MENRMIEEKPILQLHDTAQLNETPSITEVTTQNL
jgi:hypothetical protein